MHLDDHDVQHDGTSPEVTIAYRLSPGAGWRDFQDSFVVVRDRTTLRFPGDSAVVRRLFAALSEEVSDDALVADFPDLDITDLLERLVAAGVVVPFPARRRSHTAGLASTYDYGIRHEGALRLGIQTDTDGLQRLATAALTNTPDIELRPIGEADLVVLAASTPAALAQNAADAWRAGSPHLPLTSYNGRSLLIGPVVIPPFTACYDCLILRNGGTTLWPDDHWKLVHDPRFVRPWATDDLALACQLGARLAKRALLNRDDDAVGHVSAVNLADLSMYTSRLWSVPRCPTCSAIETFSTSYPWLRATNSAMASSDPTSD